MDSDTILTRLRALSNADHASGMKHFGISAANVLGVRIPELRVLAKELGKDHTLAEQLWHSGIHEARILASMIDDPMRVSEAQMERWTAGFDSWDVCDQCCGNLFVKTPFAHAKALAWTEREPEFEKRAGFALIAYLAVHDKQASDATFDPFLAAIEREASDGRNFVKKAVNWALRQLGKRNLFLNTRAIAVAHALQQRNSRAAQWVAADALRELTSEKQQHRLR